MSVLFMSVLRCVVVISKLSRVLAEELRGCLPPPRWWTTPPDLYLPCSYTNISASTVLRCNDRVYGDRYDYLLAGDEQCAPLHTQTWGRSPQSTMNISPASTNLQHQHFDITRARWIWSCILRRLPTLCWPRTNNVHRSVPRP